MIVIIVVALACALLAMGVWQFTLQQQREDSIHAQQQVKQAVIDCATQCYAIEGAYPNDVTYLEENYGLQINRNRFIVSYETLGSNVVPSIEVLVRGE